MLRYLCRKLSDFIIEHCILYINKHKTEKHTTVLKSHHANVENLCYNLHTLHPLLPVLNHYTCTPQHSTNDTVLNFVNKRSLKYTTLRKI